MEPDLQALYAEFLDFRPSKGDQRRIQIIDSAIACIAHDGIERLTFESIGKRIGMKKAHVAYYYKNQEDIIESAIKFVVATVQHTTIERIKNTKKADSQVLSFCQGTFDWLRRFPQYPPVILLMYYNSSYHPFYKRLHSEIRSAGADRIKAALAHDFPKSNSRTLYRGAKLVQAILTGHILDFATTDLGQTVDAVERQTLADIRDSLAALGFSFKN